MCRLTLSIFRVLFYAAHTHTCIYCTYTCMYTHVCTHTHSRVIVAICTHTLTHTHTHTHIYTHIHTHSYTCFSRWEPCCIPLQFKNCCYHQGSGTENSSMSCCCRPCVPIGPSRCIVRGTDSVPEPQSSLQTTGTIEEDPYCSSTKNPLGCICCTRFQRVKPEICVSAPDPERAPLLTRSTSININPEQTSTAGDGKPYHVYSWYVYIIETSMPMYM